MQHTPSIYWLPSYKSRAPSLRAPYCYAWPILVGLLRSSMCTLPLYAFPRACSILLSSPSPADSVNGCARLKPERLLSSEGMSQIGGARLTTSLPPADTVATLARSSSRTSTDSACSSSTSPATVFSMPRVSCRGAQATDQHLASLRLPAQGPWCAHRANHGSAMAASPSSCADNQQQNQRTSSNTESMTFQVSCQHAAG